MIAMKTRLETTTKTTGSGSGSGSGSGLGSVSRRGFSLVELLVVVAVIALLVTLVTVVASGALRSAGDARSAGILRSVGQGIAVFESDHGYVPPLVLEGATAGSTASGMLTPELLRVASNLSNSDVRERVREQRYMSEYSLTVYLLGIGRLNPDADATDYGLNPSGFAGHDGEAGPGLKSPGSTRAWADPRALNSDTIEISPTRQGRVYGPYLDLATLDDSLVLDEDRGLFAIEMPSGERLRYYSGWPTNDPDDPANAAKRTLGGVPPELLSPEALEAWQAETVSSGGDLQAGYRSMSAGADRALLGAKYALLSSGADGKFGDLVEGAATRTEIGFDSDGLVDFSDIENDFQERSMFELIGDNVRFVP